MMLSELLNRHDMTEDVLIQGLSEDSRQIRRGDVFVAMQGIQADGREYVPGAVSRGAAAVLCDAPVADVGVPVIEISDLREQLGVIAGRFYGEPARELSVFAVTGTNGKTSFTHLLAQALTAGGTETGVIGTMGHGRPGRLQEAGLTTPSSIDLQRRIAALKKAGCAAVVIEASSHGLMQSRLNGASIRTAVFTNITHDHLDYHGSFKEYQEAKRRLFQFSTLQNAVINLDDEFAVDLAAGISEDVRLIRFSLRSEAAEVFCPSAKFEADGIHSKIVLPDGIIEARIPLFGEFNLQNVLAVIATLVAEGWDHRQILDALGALTPVAGRMDVIRRQDGSTIVVDYAHTPDALEKCLLAVRQHYPGRRVCCVFGCGGDRDASKRPIMGQIAARHSDRLFLTSDNPRSEDPQQILRDIAAGIDSKEVIQETDRRRAITDAVTSATADEIVVVAGKGHENYQELAAGRVAFSDYEVIAEALNEVLQPENAVIGLGNTGMSYMRYLIGRGERFTVFDSVTDETREAVLAEAAPDAVLENLDTADLTGFSDIYVSPGVPLSLPVISRAKHAGVRLRGDVAVFAGLASAPLTVITGTNGKSTVAELMYRMASDQQQGVYLGGNIGEPCLDILSEDATAYIIEASSYQLELAGDISADVAVVLNLSPDHEDRYPTLEDYYDAKLSLYRHCRSAVVNRQLAQLPASFNGRPVVSFGSDLPTVENDYGLARIDDVSWIVRGNEPLVAAHELQVSGEHNLLNVMAAMACGSLMGLNDAAMADSAKDFRGLPHRSEVIAEIGGVLYVNDSKATNAGAMVTAVQSLAAERKVYLIAGGETKGAGFAGLSQQLAPFVDAIYLIGESQQVLQAELKDLDPVPCGSMEDAVAAAAKAASNGDAVLLAPGCASFDQYRNYRERGDAFRRAVEALLL
jgi:UDP-N-acetylmuramoylalanine--D-glutamate ligase